LQYWPVGCKVSGNLSKQVFLFERVFVMAEVLKYNHILQQDIGILEQRQVVVRKISIFADFSITL